MIKRNRFANIQLLHDLPTGLIIADASCFDVIYFNRKAKRLFGLINDEHYNLKKLLDIENFNLNAPNILYEDRLTLEFGKKTNVSVGIHTVNLNRRKYIIASVTDISSHKIHFEELNESRLRIESANTMKTEFMANMSHEMRTPMNAILGISQMLIKKHNDNLNEKQIEALKMINQSADRLLSLISDILDISKIDAGRIELEQGKVSLEKIFTHLKSLVYTLIDKKPIKFNIKKSANVPDKVMADQNKLMQILINVLSNSVKFTKEGKINLNVHTVSNKLYFEVSDTGIGISKEDTGKIFERYHRVQSSEARKVKGTGLGLAICKDYVKMMGGSILALSEENKGTTISFYIPLILPEAKKRAAEKKEFDGQKISIPEKKEIKDIHAVLIEPDKSLNKLFNDYLLNNGIQATSVYDGVEGYQVIIENPPDIIITELKLDRWSGYDLLKRLARVKKLASIPIIIVTSSNQKPDKNAYNYTEFIQKPVTEKGLMNCLRKCCLKDTQG